MLRSWFASWFGKRSSQTTSPARRCRLTLEALETRTVPTVTIQGLLPPTGAQEGTPAGGPLAVFTGSSTNLNDYSATVAWGDGTTTILNAGNAGIVDNGDGTFSVVATNTYAEAGTLTLSVTVADAGGNTDTQSMAVNIADAPLTGNYPNPVNGVPGSPLGAAGPVVIASFLDANPTAPASDFTGTIAWGDGKVDPVSGAAGTIVADPLLPGSWNVLGNHTYATPGAFQVVVTVQDADLAATSVTTPVIVANPSPLQVTPYDPATPLSTLTSALLKPSGGLNLVGSSFVGQNGQAGTYTGFNFHDQNTSLSLTDGILLTSGSATNALGPNNQTGAATAYGTPDAPQGAPALDALVAPDITYDANTLTLQFTAAPGVTSIQFQFVFGSEEFPEWVGQYNDVFAAFLDGKQICFDPAGNFISVNNNFFQLNNSNDNSYPAYSAGKTVVAYDIQYDGLTPALTTQAALDPTVTTHTLTFVIADTRDQVLDSGVFLTSLTGTGATTGGTGSTGGTGGTGGATTSPAPQADTGGPYTVTAGQTVALNAAGTTDVGQAPSTLTYLWDLNGNGVFGETGAAATNGNEVGMTPTFVATGLAAGTSVTVTLQVTDSNGVVSTDQAVINVVAPVGGNQPVYLGAGPGGATTLIINGTAGNDVIRVLPHGDKGDVSVVSNGVSQGVFARSSFSAIAVYGQAGNDVIRVSGDVHAPVYLFGGAGNDMLQAGGGPSFLDGGAGNDRLTGGDAASVLVGGTGSDVLKGGGGSALLLAGTTDLDPAALLAVWSASKSSTDRATAARALLVGHVFDDGQKDVLTGGDGLDLYFAGAGDVIHDRTKGEIVVQS